MKYYLYIGAYMENEEDEGLYLIEFDTETRQLIKRSSYGEWSNNPSFLTVTRENLYAVSEQKTCGYISAFKRNVHSGEVTFLNRIQTEGADMCHLCIWPGKRYLSAANYSSGSLLSASIDEDGSLGNTVEWIQHSGSGRNPRRQEGPHVHSTMVSTDGQYLYAADLGTDQVYCYKIKDNGRLQLASEDKQIHTPAGMGPRHFVFSADGKFLYLMTEMGSTLFVYAMGDSGWKQIQDILTVPNGSTYNNIGADIHFSEDYHFLYVSNRGANEITAFTVDEKSGKVRLLEYYDCAGDFPRNFALIPDAPFLAVANQRSGNVVILSRNCGTGELGTAVCEISIPHAVFVTAVPAE